MRLIITLLQPDLMYFVVPTNLVCFVMQGGGLGVHLSGWMQELVPTSLDMETIDQEREQDKSKS